MNMGVTLYETVRAFQIFQIVLATSDEPGVLRVLVSVSAWFTCRLDVRVLMYCLLVYPWLC